MSNTRDEFLSFSNKINEHISAVMLSSEVNVENYKHSIFWHYAEAKGVVIREFPFDGAARSRISGMIIKDELETTIGINSHMPPKRKNFTISHELTHFFYHMNDGNHYFTDTKESLSYNDIDLLPEFQANIGASAILLPEPVLIHLLKEGINPAKISEEYGISYSALHLRLIQTMQAEFEASYFAAQKTSNKIMNKYSCNGRSVMMELGSNLERKAIHTNPFYEAISI